MSQDQLFVLSRNATARKSQIENAGSCLEYILESEQDDFLENLSMEHVYFKAYAACFGMKRAEEMYQSELLSQNETQGG